MRHRRGQSGCVPKLKYRDASVFGDGVQLEARDHNARVHDQLTNRVLPCWMRSDAMGVYRSAGHHGGNVTIGRGFHRPASWRHGDRHVEVRVGYGRKGYFEPKLLTTRRVLYRRGRRWAGYSFRLAWAAKPYRYLRPGRPPHRIQTQRSAAPRSTLRLKAAALPLALESDRQPCA